MSMLQLNPPVPVIVKERKALAHVLIDYGAEFDLFWVCFLDNGECWCVANPDVRAQDNWSFKRHIGKLYV
jgi:hypothetical protein